MQKMAQSSLFELGDVIVTEPAEGVYGVAVVLSPRKGFSPCAILGGRRLLSITVPIWMK